MALFNRRRQAPTSFAQAPAIPEPVAGDPALLLKKAQRAHERAEEQYDREPETRARLEVLYQQAATAARYVRHPAEADAWLGLADVRRYQKGRRDDTLAAFNEAIATGHDRADVWDAYLDYVTYAPSAQFLLDITAAMPQPIRAGRISLLLSVAERRDRWGTMAPEDGQGYLWRLPDLLRQLDDVESLGALLSHLGLREEHDGSHADAVAILSEAAATGYATPAAIDRLTVHLVKAEQWAKALPVLEAALQQPIASDTMRERLSRRLARCQRQFR